MIEKFIDTTKLEYEEAKDFTMYELLTALRHTRYQKGGVELKKIAEIIKEVFDKSEIDFLSKNLDK